MINGTQFITALTTKALSHAKQLLHTAVVVTALSVAVLKGTSNAFDRRIHDLCPHKGQSFVAAAMRELLNLYDSPKDKIQDAYMPLHSSSLWNLPLTLSAL